MLLLGHGDGGGGAQAEMLERMLRMRDLRGLPRVIPMAPVDFFKRMEARAKPLLKWSGELYFELHRGTYTTHAQVKRGNRQCEMLLREVEFWASVGPLDAYPQVELDELWRLVLLNQFHDVLPGSSITDVYVDCHKHHKEVLERAKALLDNAMTALDPVSSVKRAKTDGAGPASRVYNSLPWPRTEVVSLPDGSIQLADVAAMCTGSTSASHTKELLSRTPSQNRVSKQGDFIILENSHLVAKINVKSGGLCSLLHRATGREAIQSGTEANSFVIFDDVNLFWDAWDTEVFHLEKKKSISGANVSVTVCHDDAILSAVKISMRLSPRSTLEQVISLAHMSPRLDFRCTVEWNENRRFLKVEFPTTVRSPYGQATFETQFGHLQRPTHRNTSWDMARFEVCAHKWADLSSYGFGVAILNDCKYGHAIEDNLIRLSLIRSPKAPDPECDIGTHLFTYSLMPHGGTFQEAGVIQQAYNLNAPLIVAAGGGGAVVAGAPFFTLTQQPANQVILETVKRAQDEPNCLVLRFYESFGGTQRFTLHSRIPFRKAEVVNILEHPMEEGDDLLSYAISVSPAQSTLSATMTPFKVLSVKIWL